MLSPALSSMYILGLIPRNFAELAEAVLIGNVPFQDIQELWEPLFKK